ncbi:hypothetical protein D3C76_835030 [compost metagenome]
MLEILVHLEVDQENFPETLQLLRVEVPDTASMMPAPALKSGWEADTRCSKDLGDTFLKNGVALLMPIPSAIMPHTMKYLFNPMHIESTQAVLTSEVFRLDSRLLRKC